MAASSPDGGAVRPVEVPYELLVAVGDEDEARVDALIEEAFGPDGLGLVTISGVPGFVQARQRLLPLAAKLARLDAPALARLEHAPSRFLLGWSHGRETLSESGRADVHKGSFYANPTTDAPAEDDPTVTPEDVARYPGYYHRNVWPTAPAAKAAAAPPSSSSLPELEPAFKLLGSIVVDTGLLLAARCDAYVRRAWERRCGGSGAADAAPSPPSPSSPPRPPASLEGVLSASRCHKARLLHYFPPGAGAGVVAATAAAADAAAGAAAGGRDGGEAGTTAGAATAAAATATTTADDGQADADGWCGWHRDHGALTGLTCAMYTRPSATRAPRLSCADDAQGVASFAGGAAAAEQEEEEPSADPSPRPASPPDARAGLYVRTRSGRAARADIPAEHLAFQVGQAAAILSGGLLCATPHCVRAPSGVAAAAGGVSRETFAVFLQPDVRAPLSVPLPPAAAAAATAEEAAPPPPPPLLLSRCDALATLMLTTADSGLYRPGDSFGDFAERTVRENSRTEGAVAGGKAGGAGGAGGGGGGDDAANEADSPGARPRRLDLAAAVYVVHE